MSSRVPDPADPFEEEGLPGMNDGLPAKRITGDEQDGIPAPHDRASAVEDYGTTAREQQEGEPVSVRVQREQPDFDASRPADDTDAADQPYPSDRDERAGRLIAPDEGAREDREPSEVGYDVGTDTGGFSAEERALRVEREH